MHAVHGGCHCGMVSLEAAFTAALDVYCPRACDCAFCRKHGAAYVSDPAGSLLISARESQAVGRYRQGDALADMLLCRECGVLLGALYAPAAGQLFGVINVQATAQVSEFGAWQAVSPRELGAAQKVRRWQSIWFPNVIVRS